MIKVKRLYMTDIINAPYFDRLFYKILNSLSGGLKGGECLVLNPLKWSLMSLIFFICSLICLVGFASLCDVAAFFFRCLQNERFKV